MCEGVKYSDGTHIATGECILRPDSVRSLCFVIERNKKKKINKGESGEKKTILDGPSGEIARISSFRALVFGLKWSFANLFNDCFER